jgi:aldose 1-epimerase
VGRYVNLLPAETSLKLPSGDSIKLPSFPTKGSCLHGGPSPAGWDEKVLTSLSLEQADLFSAKEIAFLRAQSAGVWSLTSPHGEGGHLGTVYCEVAIAVLDSSAAGELGQIIVVYRARVTDRPCTALNLTHHWGFNLAASAIAKGQPVPGRDISIQDHILTVKSKEILNIDPNTSRPSGSVLPLSTPSAASKDFREGKTIGKVGAGYPVGTGELGQGSLADGYCDFWVFDREPRRCTVSGSEKEDMNVFTDIAGE